MPFLFFMPMIMLGGMMRLLEDRPRPANED
jgi:hypothetical protein